MDLFELCKGILPHKMKLVSPSVNSPNRQLEQFLGSIIGLAVGDALGASVEFRPHDYFIAHPVEEMKGGGTWGLETGQWTDDTSMGLCLASSLISKGCYDPYDQMVRYKWWFQYGYLSSTGQCFDIGNATKDSLQEFIRRQKCFCKKFHYEESDVDYLSWNKIQSVVNFDINCSADGVAGNGALMRLAPIPLFFYRNPELAVEYAGRSARLTHGDQKAVDACRYYAALIVAALQGESKQQILSKDFYKLHLKWFGPQLLHPEVRNVALGSYQNSRGYEGGIRGKGYIVNALEAALWAFWSDDNSFKKGALKAVNLGDDTDTTAAIYGQLAGAYYGFQGIHKDWLKKVYATNLLENIGQWLYLKGTKYDTTSEDNDIISLARSITTIPSTLNQTDFSGNPSTYSKDIQTNQLTDRQAKARQAHQQEFSQDYHPSNSALQQGRSMIHTNDNSFMYSPDNNTGQPIRFNQTKPKQNPSYQDSSSSNLFLQNYRTDSQFEERSQDRDNNLKSISTRSHQSKYPTNSHQSTQQRQSSTRPTSIPNNSSYDYQTYSRPPYSSAYNNDSIDYDLYRRTYYLPQTSSVARLSSTSSTNQSIGGSHRNSLPASYQINNAYNSLPRYPKTGQ